VPRPGPRARVSQWPWSQLPYSALSTRWRRPKTPNSNIPSQPDLPATYRRRGGTRQGAAASYGHPVVHRGAEVVDGDDTGPLSRYVLARASLSAGKRSASEAALSACHRTTFRRVRGWQDPAGGCAMTGWARSGPLTSGSSGGPSTAHGRGSPQPSSQRRTPLTTPAGPCRSTPRSSGPTSNTQEGAERAQRAGRPRTGAVPPQAEHQNPSAADGHARPPTLAPSPRAGPVTHPPSRR
jgi:hypothetical protein